MEIPPKMLICVTHLLNCYLVGVWSIIIRVMWSLPYKL